jgi:hypothetical protein
MRKSRKLAVAFLGLLGVGCTSVSHCQQPSKSPETNVLFAVWPTEKGKKPDSPLLDPIVVLIGNQLLKPPEYDDSTDAKKQASDAEFTRFDKKYYRPGQVYPLFIHGSAQGTAAVEAPTSISCIDHMVTARLSNIPSSGHLELAAASLVALRTHPNRDRDATAEDRSAFIEVASSEFRRRSVNIPVTRLKIDYLYSVSLTENGPNSLIGRVTVDQKTAIYHLLLLAVRETQGYVAELSSYHVAKDVEDHTDEISEDLIDHLDLGSNDTDAIVTMSHYYESWDYAIYRRENGRWKVAYKGGGGGC